MCSGSAEVGGSRSGDDRGRVVSRQGLIPGWFVKCWYGVGVFLVTLVGWGVLNR